MLKLYLLDHTYCTQDGRALRLSSKSLALLAYLALERRPQHRDHVADLLWDSAGALRNLRVELSRLRQRGIDLFPQNQPMLDVQLATDLDEWLNAPEDLEDAPLGAWLSASAGLPLSGLDDVGTLGFAGWLDTRRAMISQLIEERLARRHAQMLRRGAGSAALIEGHMRRRGMPVPTSRVARAPAARPTFERPEVRAKLQDVLRRAEQRPQLLVIEDRPGSDVPEVAGQVAAQAGWHLLEVNAPAQADMVISVLERLAPADPASPARPGAEGEQLTQTWARLAATGHKVVVAIHVGPQLPTSVIRSLHYAMTLPGRLAVMLCCAQHSSGALQQELAAAFDHNRVHRLVVPTLGVGEIVKALAHAEVPGSAEQRLERALVIAQHSEGWGLLARSLITRAADGDADVALPDEVRDVLLTEVAALPPRLRTALARLATIHSPFDLPLATVLLGEDAAELLGEAERRGLLVTAAPQEGVGMPHLRYQSSDLDDQLTLAGEPLRAALSGSLTSSERRGLRALLARHHLDAEQDAALALYYAQRAARSDVADVARTQLDLGPAGHVVKRAPATLHSGHHDQWGESAGTRREVRTGNGYRVALEAGHLQVLRYGVHTRAPLLRLRWPRVPAGDWHVVARVDVFREAEDLGRMEPGYPLGLQLPGDALRVYGPEELWVPAGLPDAPPGGRVPMCRWFRLEGRCAAGPAELQVRALDVALTIASWHVGGDVLVPAAGNRNPHR